MLCKKCVLPENKPDIVLNAEGICNICVDFKKNNSVKAGPVLLESEMIKILNRHKGKGKYDCLVMCSGGKDSTLGLYYMKKRYKMNPLVLTFDHGFENGQALDNIRMAVDALGVDWLYYKTDYMKDIFSQMIKTGTTAPICHVCAIWYLGFTCELASRYGIRLIVAGWTKGQSLGGKETAVEYKAMSRATADFVEKYLRTDCKYRNFPRSIKESLDMSGRRSGLEFISPHWFLQYDMDTSREILQKELGWKLQSLSYPKNSTNCMMNFINVYLSIKNYGYTHYHIEMSKLIRLGEISRDESLKALEIDFDLNFLNGIAGSIGCRID